MYEPIEELYFNWLCAKVLSFDVSNNYLDLMKILYSTEFVWIITGDKNRAEDGLELREYFLSEVSVENNRSWFELPASVLEVLIAFANRASFQTDIPMQEWFWIFITNLTLDEYRRVSPNQRVIIDKILQTFIWRTYEYNGYGGLFPLDDARDDQRKIEIWYQFNTYLDDKGLF